jgi:hypothetical protein
MRMNLHRLGQQRSLAYHRVIADRLRCDPAILEKARARVGDWIHRSRTPPFYAPQWREVLSRDIEAITAFLVDDDELARELRRSSPFAGALTADERWRIWRQVAEQEAGDRDAR